jgi:DoxX-like family
MSIMQKSMAMSFLRWSLGLVVLWESYRFAVSTTAVHHLQGMGLPAWIAPVLGGMEIAAAVVFLVPKLRRVGGYSLLAIFAIAAALHILHREFEIGTLVVYCAAVLVCIPAGAPRTEEPV